MNKGTDRKCAGFPAIFFQLLHPVWSPKWLPSLKDIKTFMKTCTLRKPQMYTHRSHTLRDVHCTNRISYCCCNKLPQTSWLKATQIYYLIALRVRSPKWVPWVAIKVSAGLVPPGGPRGNLFPNQFQLLEAACIPWLVAPPSIFKAAA